MTDLISPDSYRITSHAGAVLAVGLAAMLLGLFVLVREGRSALGVKFFLFAGSSGVWLACFGMAAASRAEAEAYAWLRLSQFAVIFIPATVFSLTAAIVQRERRLRGAVLACVGFSTIYAFVHGATTLHLAGVYHYPWGYYARYGPAAPLFLAYFFAVMVFILAQLVREYRSSTHERTRRRMAGMVAAFAAGYLAAVDFVPAFGAAWYPFGYAGVAAYIVIGAAVIIRYRLVGITPELAAGMILKTMHDAVIAVDLDGTIRLANRAAHAYLGFPEPELEGRTLRSTIDLPPDWRDLDALKEGPRRSQEFVWTGRTGRRIDVSLSASIIRDRDGMPAGAAYIATDITERTRAEAQLVRSSEELRQANRELQDFAYIVSHDLRAPLVSIRGFVREVEFAVREVKTIIDAQQPGPAEAERRRLDDILAHDLDHSFSFINSSVIRMDAQISALLRLSRIGRRELHVEEIDMRSLTNAILDSLAHQISSRRVRVTLGPLPAVRADRTAVEQIMGNLVDNALKYLDASRDGELAITGEEREDAVVFHVRDNGRGISRDDLPRVFEMFRRSGRLDVPGEGMGLAYVKALLRRHQGSIWCESEPGRGSTFSFSLPNVPCPAAQRAPGPQEAL